MRPICLALGTGLVGLAVLPAVTAAQQADEPQRGGLLNFAVSAEPPNYDCHANTSFAFIHPVRPHYNTLLKFDAAKLSRRSKATSPSRGTSRTTA